MNGAVTQPISPGARDVASRFVRSRLRVSPLTAYPGTVPDTAAEAYAIQDMAIGMWPDRIVGWKVARIAPAWERQFSEPRLNGPVFSRNLHVAHSGEIRACPVFDGGFAAVETEILIRVRAQAPADKLDWRIDEAVEYVGGVHMGVEIAGSPLPTLNDHGPGAVIADFGGNWGVLVGGEIPNWRALEKIACETFIDGNSVGAKEVVMVPGPLSAFAFTLGKCAARGRPLEAGTWISTGMITGVHDIRIGQQSRHVFAGCGEVGCRTVRAGPFE
jgi:2-keto-4-pentenoate hydratase